MLLCDSFIFRNLDHHIYEASLNCKIENVHKRISTGQTSACYNEDVRNEPISYKSCGSRRQKMLPVECWGCLCVTVEVCRTVEVIWMLPVLVIYIIMVAAIAMMYWCFCLLITHIAVFKIPAFFIGSRRFKVLWTNLVASSPVSSCHWNIVQTDIKYHFRPIEQKNSLKSPHDPNVDDFCLFLKGQFHLVGPVQNGARPFQNEILGQLIFLKNFGLCILCIPYKQ